MMPLVYCCIAPHGGEVIPKLTTEITALKFLKTRKGMLRIAKDVREAKPDIIVIATPHNLRLWQSIGVIFSENSSGRVEGSRGSKRAVRLKVKCDQEFARNLLNRARKKGLPVVGANYGSAEGSASDMPMDWGTLIPLWFVLRGRKKDPKVVVVTPSREIPLAQDYQFGRVIAELAENSSKRCVFIASADQAHAHKRSGPYGFSKAAEEYDQFVLDAIEKNRIISVMNLGSKFVEDAKPDSLWQMAMLAGALSKVKMQAQLFSYQVPTYFGMICAGFKRI
jgi:aromatic ring-opening dioxygenase LigB subunit